MKVNLGFVVALSLLSVNLFAAGDGTPSPQIALSLAKDYAFNTAFSNILDESSSVDALPKGENPSQFLFTATAKNPGVPDCVIEIEVSKETGLAFQDKIESCQNLPASN